MVRHLWLKFDINTSPPNPPRAGNGSPVPLYWGWMIERGQVTADPVKTGKVGPVVSSVYCILYPQYGTCIYLTSILYSQYGMLYTQYGILYTQYDILYTQYGILYTQYGILSMVYVFILQVEGYYQNTWSKNPTVCGPIGQIGHT